MIPPKPPMDWSLFRRRLSSLARGAAPDVTPPASERTAAIVFPLLTCNAHCPFCSSRTYTPEGITAPLDYRRARERSRNPLVRLLRRKPAFRPVTEYTHTLDEARATYDQLRADGVETISIQGGEPTLFDGLCELIEYGRALGFREQIVITNGRRLRDPAFAARLFASGVTGIGISIFGATAPTHDAAMGVRRAFDDLLEGVRNLAALGAFERSSPVHCTAQFTLYSGNHAELVEMYRFWRREGLRSFAVQLLRETDNTRRDPPERWFFNLQKLKPGLQTCLDEVLRDPEVFFSFSEVFYCLLDPGYLAFVLRDVSSNPGLLDEKIQVSRHHQTVGGFTSGDPGPEPDPSEALLSMCDGCDLRQTCTRLEPQYLQLFSGSLRPMKVAAQVRSLAAQELDAQALARLRPLVKLQPRLAALGVDADTLTRLRVRVAAAGLEAGAHDVDLLLDEAWQRPVRDQLQFGSTRYRPTEFRWVDLRSLGAGAALASITALKARWSACDDPAIAALLDPIADAAPTAATPLWAMFTHWVRRDATGPIQGDDLMVVTTVYDGRYLDPAVLSLLYAELTAPPSPPGA